MQTLHPHRSTQAVDSLLEQTMLAIKSLAFTYAESIIPYSVTPLIPPTRVVMTVEEQRIQNWLKMICRWSPPKPLFDWDKVFDALKEAMIGIARSHYTTWHDALPKHPLPSSDDDSRPADIVHRSSRHSMSHQHTPQA